MLTAKATLDLGPDAAIVLDGTEWTVERVQPQFGLVILVDTGGTRWTTSMRFLANHPDCRQSSRTTAVTAAAQGRQEPSLNDLSAHNRVRVELRVAHLLEMETGYRGGDPLRPKPGEPKPCYDPDVTTLVERRQAKVAELAAMDPDLSRPMGLHRVGYRTLQRWQHRYRLVGPIGCADDRWLRTYLGHPRLKDAVREAIYAVKAETLYRSRMNMRTKERLIYQYVRANFGAEALAQIPSYETLRKIWRDWFGSGRGRQRNIRTAASVVSGQHVVVYRPGQVVVLDTTVLPVKVRERVFDDSRSVHLTLAMDAYTHSLPAYRLTLVSDRSVDVAMLLRDIAMPLPMRPGWGADMEWPYPGVPSSIVAEFAGHPVAGLPFFTPETVTTDNGTPYRNHDLVEVQRVLGINILPARVFRPTDKQVIERTFGVIRSLLFEHLLGYTGVDVYDRGADPEVDAVLTIEQMEHLIATWIVKIWQNRRLGECAPCWGPGEDHSPNTLFAAAMEQGGFAMQIPSPELYYQLLPEHNVAIDPDRGVRINRLWYDGDALAEYRHLPSRRGGKHRGTWSIRCDPRDVRCVYFQDPQTHQWSSLRWTGLPPEGEIPAFSDARADELLAAAHTAGLKPRTDAELLPLLLDLLDAAVPVKSWPTMKKAQRLRHSRADQQGQAADTDRAALASAEQAGESPAGMEPSGAAAAQQDQSTVECHRQRATQLREATRSDRRRRREAALRAQSVSVATPLGHGNQKLSVFRLIDDDQQVCPLTSQNGADESNSP